MNNISLVLAVMLQCCALNVRAGDFFVGGELAPIVFWQGKKQDCFFNCSPYSSQQDETALGYGIYTGQWLDRDDAGKLGWRVSYDDLGAIKGSTTARIGPNTGVGTWRYAATAVHAEALLGVALKQGTLYSKIGIFRSSAKAEGSDVFGGGAYSRRVSGTGLVLGAGYDFPLAGQLSVSAALDGFVGVRVVDPVSPVTTTTENILKIAVGVAYHF